LAIAWVKVMTPNITEIFFNFMALKAMLKFRLAAWLRQNFLHMKHYFSSNGFFSVMTSL